MRVFIIAAISILTFSAQAQNKTADTIWVDGICGMCEDRIESALDVKGIWVAEWDVDSQELYVVYKESKISKEQICALINDAGHDTEISKASDEQYAKVHGCCLYRDEAIKKQHQKGATDED
jgi:mercuric ion binding protein